MKFKNILICVIYVLLSVSCVMRFDFCLVIIFGGNIILLSNVVLIKFRLLFVYWDWVMFYYGILIIFFFFFSWSDIWIKMN